MKVKICPGCGKHNLEKAWICADCGNTLSLKTVFNIADHKIVDGQIPEKLSLSNISSFLQVDVEEILIPINRDHESIIRGANITQVSKISTPKFGFLILTSLRLILVYFTSDTIRIKSYIGGVLEMGVIGGSIAEALGTNEVPKHGLIYAGSFGYASDCPKQPLTRKEKFSREVKIYQIEDLSSIKLHWMGNLISITARARRAISDKSKDSSSAIKAVDLIFGEDDVITISFIMPHEGREIYKSLKELVDK